MEIKSDDQVNLDALFEEIRKDADAFTKILPQLFTAELLAIDYRRTRKENHDNEGRCPACQDGLG